MYTQWAVMEPVCKRKGQPIRGHKRLLSTNRRVGKCHQNTDCHLGPPLTMGPGISDRQLTLRHNTVGQGRSQRMRQPFYMGSICF